MSYQKSFKNHVSLGPVEFECPKTQQYVKIEFDDIGKEHERIHGKETITLWIDLCPACEGSHEILN